MQSTRRNVRDLVRDIRRRWRRRALVQGSALTLLTFLLGGTLLLLAYTRLDPGPTALVIGGGLGMLAVLGVFAWFVVRPLLRRMSDQQIALFVEEKMPALEDRLNSAIEVEGGLDKEHDRLLDQLVDDAARRAEAIPPDTVVDQKKARVLAYATGASLVLFLLFGYTSFSDLRVGLAEVDLKTVAAPLRPYLTVSPGHAEIEKGAAQEIIAELKKEAAGEVVLHFREGEGEWQRATMEQGLGEPAYLYEFLDVQQPIEYFVEAGERRSDPFRISLYEFPVVEQIDVTYAYPAYTGLQPYTETDGGDIRGLRGSTVGLTVATTGAVTQADLVLNEEQTLPMEALGEGRFRARLPLAEEGSYHVRLTDRAAKTNKFPDEYLIVPLDDEKPRVTVVDPQRDVRANALEEVLVVGEVQDDYGVKDLRLRFSVNGAEEQTVRLMPPDSARARRAGGDHLFFLEDYNLQPGDVISYYIEAEDYFHPGSEATDMYFVEVIPFDQQFQQASNMGGMAGAQPSAVVLNQQQIIAATWKLYRERDEMPEGDFDEAVRGLAQAQRNLRENIAERINSTAFSLELQLNEDNKKIVEHLRVAMQEMERAEGDLTAARLQEALTPERRALRELLRADALNKERQVALNQQGQGGGSSSTEERMTELMDLELDISKDKYETQQQRRGDQQGGQPELDETLQKLRDLARRQENLANQAQQPALEGEDKKRRVERLQREQDALRQQTESLASQMRQQAQGDRQQAQQTNEGLERVAENMREAERALKRGDTQRAAARQQQALNELERLQQDLSLARNDDTRQMLEDLARRFDRMQEGEERLSQDLEKATREAEARAGRADKGALERLQRQRQGQREELERMGRQAEAVRDRTKEDPEAASAARNLVQQMRREALDEKMRASEEAFERGWLDRAERLEEEITRAMEGLEEQVRALEGGLPTTEEENLARALEDLRELTRQMQQLEAQSRQQGQQGQQGDRQARADAARMERQLERAQESLESLQQQMGGNPQAQQALRGLQQFLTRADNTGIRLEGEAAKAFFNDRVYQPLSQLEEALAAQLDLIALEKKLYGARPEDVPPAYRDLVEQYYERLAKSNR